jgi:outer membrane protein assembly factor BamE (lipoprotein component of BamABCDE complex)
MFLKKSAFKKIALFTGLLFLFTMPTTSCSPLIQVISCVLHPSVPEMDAYRISKYSVVEGKSSPGDIRKLLGEPAGEWLSGGQTTWYYPIRKRIPEIIPACLLNIVFDNNGTVVNWSFINPYTNLTLPIRETLPEADKDREKLCFPPPRIELAQDIKNSISKKEDIQRMFDAWHSDFPVVKKNKTENGEIWSYYVERPSPLYVPPFYYRITFENDVVKHAGFQGYGSCPVL